MIYISPMIYCTFRPPDWVSSRPDLYFPAFIRQELGRTGRSSVKDLSSFSSSLPRRTGLASLSLFLFLALSRLSLSLTAIRFPRQMFRWASLCELFPTFSPPPVGQQSITWLRSGLSLVAWLPPDVVRNVNLLHRKLLLLKKFLWCKRVEQ